MTVTCKKQLVGWIALFLLLLVILFRALSHDPSDFRVFYHAWHLVLSGRGDLIYRDSPDRFLYSPGFAWFLAPLAFLSLRVAFGFWSLLKVLAVFWAAKWVATEALSPIGSSKKPQDFNKVLFCVFFGILLAIRPLLIDFEYGQVNVFILAFSVWGLSTHLDSKCSRLSVSLSWFLLSWIALAKIFPLPLLLVPFALSVGGAREKVNLERLSVLVAVIFSLIAPCISLGWAKTARLFFDWRDALVARGFPMESHNQSFLALIQHFLSGQPTKVLSEGGHSLFFGGAWLSSHQILYVSLFWVLITFGLILAWVMRGPKANSAKWAVILVGLLIIPSHLVWKPYFVMSLPLIVFALSRVVVQKSRAWNSVLFVVLFFGMNLTTFDVWGHKWGPFLEALSTLLIVHLSLLAWVAVL